MIFADYPGHFVAITLLILSAGFVFLAFYSNELQKDKYKYLRVILPGLKVLTIMILLLILWNPSHSELVNSTSKNSVLVLFDTSKSMSVKEDFQKTRLDKALGIFEEIFISSNEDTPEYKILGFDNDVYHSGSTQLLRRWGNQTNMHKVIEMLGKYDKINSETEIDTSDSIDPNEDEETLIANPSTEFRMVSLSNHYFSDTKGAIIFTDGQADDNRAATYLPLNRTDFPIVLVGIGLRKAGIDIELKSVKAPLKALIDSIYNVDVLVSSKTLPGEPVIVELLKDEVVIDSFEISPEKFTENKQHDTGNNNDDMKTVVNFTVAANVLGDHSISARVKEIENEMNLANNIQSTIVEVIDSENMNVLYYTQAAEFNAGKLRQVLSLDPRVNLNFCMDAIKSAELSTKANKKLGYTMLPETKEEFNQYDIIILGNCWLDNLSSTQIDALYDFVVRRGGGLLLLPGREEYGPALWKNAKAKSLLPVIFNSNEPKLWPPEPQPVKLTLEGENTKIFSQDEIPRYDFPVSAFYNIEKPKPASTTLAISGDMPLVTFHRIGKGRVCLLNISKLFQWYREDKKGGDLYNLISGLTSYLGQNRGNSSKVELFAERTNQENNNIRFTAYVCDNAFSALEQANVLLNFNNQTYIMDSAGDGYYIMEIENIDTQRIVASAQAEFAGEFLGQNSITVNLPSRKNEMSDILFNEDFLQSLAKQLNGKYIYAEDIDSDIAKIFDAQTQLGYTREIESIWPRWSLFAVLCFILSFEWFIRRAKGLV